MAKLGSETNMTYAREWTISIPSLKGGVGKSTTTAQVANLAASFGLKVLAIDLDSNGGLTSITGASAPRNGRTVRDFLDGDLGERGECIQRPANWQPDPELPFHEGGALIEGGRLDVIPSGPDISESISRPGSQAEVRLRDALAEGGFANDYDLVLVDAPGTEGPVMQLALHAAAQIVFPLKPVSLGLKGFSLVVKTAIRFATPETPLTSLNAVGAVVTEFQKNRLEHTEVMEYAREVLAQDLPTVPWIGDPVPSRAAVSDAVSMQEPVTSMGAWRDTITNRTRLMDAAAAYSAITIAIIREVLGDASADQIVALLKDSDLPDEAKTMIMSGVGVTETQKEH